MSLLNKLEMNKITEVCEKLHIRSYGHSETNCISELFTSNSKDIRRSVSPFKYTGPRIAKHMCHLLYFYVFA